MPGILREGQVIITSIDVQRAAQREAYKMGSLADIPSERIALFRWQERQKEGTDLPLDSALRPTALKLLDEARYMLAPLTQWAASEDDHSVSVTTLDGTRNITIEPEFISITKDERTVSVRLQSNKIEVQHVDEKGQLHFGSLSRTSGGFQDYFLDSLESVLLVANLGDDVTDRALTVLDNFRPTDLQKYSHEADSHTTQAPSASLLQRAPGRGSLQPIDAPIAPSTISEGIGPKLRERLQEPYQWVAIPEGLQRAIDRHRKKFPDEPKPDNVLAQEIALRRRLDAYRRRYPNDKRHDHKIIPLLNIPSYGMPEWLRIRVQEYQRTHSGDERTAEAIARQFAREEMTGISPEMKHLVRKQMQSHPEISPFEIAQALNPPRKHVLVSQEEFAAMLEKVIADQETAIANGGSGILPPSMAADIPKARELMQRLAANHPTYQIRYPWPQSSSRGEQIANIFEVIRRFGPTFQEPEIEVPEVTTGEHFYMDERGAYRRLVDGTLLPTMRVPLRPAPGPQQAERIVERQPAISPTVSAESDSMELPPSPPRRAIGGFYIPEAVKPMFRDLLRLRSFEQFMERMAQPEGGINFFSPVNSMDNRQWIGIEDANHNRRAMLSAPRAESEKDLANGYIDIDDPTHRIRIKLRNGDIEFIRFGMIDADDINDLQTYSPTQEKAEALYHLLDSVYVQMLDQANKFMGSQAMSNVAWQVYSVLSALKNIPSTQERSQVRQPIAQYA